MPIGGIWETALAAMPVIEGVMNRGAQKQANAANQDMALADRQMQYEFAKNGIQWKVEDAKKAGLHPLAALGSQGISASPTAIGAIPEDGLAQGVGRMGQDITRAVMATQTGEERAVKALQLQNMQTDLKGKEIDNEIRLHQLRQLQGSGISFPGADNLIPGQGNSPLIMNKAMERTRSHPNMPGTEPGAKPGRGFYVTDDLTLVPVPSKDTKESIEDNWIQESMHALRNNLLPNWTGGNPPPGFYWSPWHQGYRREGEGYHWLKRPWHK